MMALKIDLHDAPSELSVVLIGPRVCGAEPVKSQMNSSGVTVTAT
jgi:hypothetical protein